MFTFGEQQNFIQVDVDGFGPNSKELNMNIGHSFWILIPSHRLCESSEMFSITEDSKSSSIWPEKNISWHL